MENGEEASCAWPGRRPRPLGCGGQREAAAQYSAVEGSAARPPRRPYISTFPSRCRALPAVWARPPPSALTLHRLRAEAGYPLDDSAAEASGLGVYAAGDRRRGAGGWTAVYTFFKPAPHLVRNYSPRSK